MSPRAIAYYVLAAAREGKLAPIISDARAVTDTDLVPQAVILTAIAIGFSIQSLRRVVAIELAREHPILESHEIEKNNLP